MNQKLLQQIKTAINDAVNKNSLSIDELCALNEELYSLHTVVVDARKKNNRDIAKHLLYMVLLPDLKVPAKAYKAGNRTVMFSRLENNERRTYEGNLDLMERDLEDWADLYAPANVSADLKEPTRLFAHDLFLTCLTNSRQSIRLVSWRPLKTKERTGGKA